MEPFLPGRTFQARVRAMYEDWPSYVYSLTKLPDPLFNQLPIEEISVTAGVGLPGLENSRVFDVLAKLGDWLKHVEMNTRHWWPEFEQNPAKFNHSPGQFKMECLVTILQRYLGVKYNLPFHEGDYDARDPRNLFLHGLFSGHGGTCVTMPMLYIAVGRRLGYPLYLVRAREHFFVRWEGQGERFNIEATQPGFEPYDDEHFRHWPKPLTQENLDSGSYMYNLSRREEAVVCLVERGHCLVDHLATREALLAYSLANEMVPDDNCTMGAWVVAEILDRSFGEYKKKAIAKNRDSFALRDVEILCFPKGAEPPQWYWATQCLARLKRLHPEARINWVND